MPHLAQQGPTQVPLLRASLAPQARTVMTARLPARVAPWVRTALLVQHHALIRVLQASTQARLPPASLVPRDHIVVLVTLHLALPVLLALSIPERAARLLVHASLVRQAFTASRLEPRAATNVLQALLMMYRAHLFAPAALRVHIAWQALHTVIIVRGAFLVILLALACVNHVLRIPIHFRAFPCAFPACGALGV